MLAISASRPQVVILGLDPRIHGQEALDVMAGWLRVARLDCFLSCFDMCVPYPWILGSGPRMTENGMGIKASLGLRRLAGLASAIFQSVPDIGD